MTSTSDTQSFKLESNEWKNIFTVDLAQNSAAAQSKMGEYNKAVTKYTNELSAVSETFREILKNISDEYKNQSGEGGAYLPMITNPAVVDPDNVNGDESGLIRGRISVATETLSNLRSAVRASIEDIRRDMSTEDIKFTGDGGTMPAFSSALDEYKTAKQYNDVAKQQYAQQTENHVISFATNIAIFAGAVGIVYFAVNGRPNHIMR